MKKFNMKAILAATMAATMMTITCGTAYAETNSDMSDVISETTELTDIGGYACYQREGNYWTVLDGEEYLVLDTRKAIEAEASRSSIGVASTQADTIKPPAGWKNNTYVSVPNGTSFTDNVNMTNGEYYSPILNITPTGRDFRFKISTNHILNHDYDFIFNYHHQKYIDDWDPERVHLNFNGVINFKILIPGTASYVIDAVAINILPQEGSRNDFQYTFTPSV